ncbi:DNA binding protein [Gordonia phage Tardus]|uniref:DNA binding protein n=1 Tax=Gordonia phage Tardus TaxID=2939734 RepID=A0A9E7J755_9CAUD|nr:DNA binding protein [Gordonia phage Tardus]
MTRLRRAWRREWQENGELIIFLAAHLLLMVAVFVLAVWTS